MDVSVRFFAGLADATGCREIVVQMPVGSSVADVWEDVVQRFPAAGDFGSSIRAARNLNYAAWDEVVATGDEVAFLPPVSGGDGRPTGSFVEITRDPLSADALLLKVIHPSSGAAVLFAGTVREFTDNRRTVYLEYEAYTEMATREMDQVCREIAERWPGTRVAMAHRTGRLDIGEASVLIAVATPHRSEAFAAGRYAIDRLKEIVPIWKKEIWADGEEWVGPQTGPAEAAGTGGFT